MKSVSPSALNYTQYVDHILDPEDIHDAERVTPATATNGLFVVMAIILTVLHAFNLYLFLGTGMWPVIPLLIHLFISAITLLIAYAQYRKGKLCPWRIIILKGEGALKLGAIAADQFAKQQPEATEAQIAAEHTRFTRAPLCLAVISTPKLGTKPVWEQELSAGAVCLNILHAANALGYGAKWLTEWVAYDEAILAALLNTAPATDTLDGPARIAGFIYLGTKTAETPDRERPMLENVVGEF
jgi:nitroreductase